MNEDLLTKSCSSGTTVKWLNWEKMKNNTSEYIILLMTKEIGHRTISLLNHNFISDTKRQ